VGPAVVEFGSGEADTGNNQCGIYRNYWREHVSQTWWRCTCSQCLLVISVAVVFVRMMW